MSTQARLKTLLGFDDRITLLIGIPVVAFLVPLLFFQATLADGLPAYLPKFIISLVYTMAYWFSVRAIIIYIRGRFPDYEDTRKRILYTVGLVSIVFFLICALLDLAHLSLKDFAQNPNVSKFDYHVASATVLVLCTTIYESVFLYSRWKQSVSETERLRRENIESQLQGLRDQVNPHFLFNSLNTLIYIIPEDPDRAVRFVQMLSKVYRYILEIKDRKLIELEEELRFLDAFVFLLKERFGENLEIRLQVPERFHSYQVVPLSMQMLFENAIKHNVISTEKPLTIEVLVADDHLIVKNNLQRKKQVMTSTKIGLENIKNRYAFFSANQVQVLAHEEVFEVRLPLIKSTASTPVTA